MATELSAGSVVAGFRVESLLGHGAMAEVYRARDEAGDRVVALKLLGEGLASDERFRQRFLRESRLAASLHHAHIVPTLASGEDDGRLFLAMEYVDGMDLRQLLRVEGCLEPERAVGLAEQVAEALDAAHASGLVHRDVKPANILVGSDDNGGDYAYVCDFGLARHVSSASSLTGDRGFVGTIDYVSPEQIEGNRVDARADVYSLGCLLFECLAGVRPLERDSELSVVFAHLNEPPPRLTGLRPELPAAFDEVVATALAKNPDERYSSCGELAAAARVALRGEVVARRRPRRLIVPAVVLLAVVAVFGAVLLTRHGGSAAPVTITPTSIAGAKLGDSNVTLSSLWGGGQKLSMQTPPDYSVLTNRSRHVSAYFVGTTDKAVEITTWNQGDRTAEGIGPCSTVAELKQVYGGRLKPSPNSTHNGIVWAYTVGKHMVFAMGPFPTDRPTQVEAVGIYSNTLRSAGFNALNDGPCTAGPPNVIASTTARQAASPTPRLTQTIASRRFAPQLRIQVPSGWSARSDRRQEFVLSAPSGAALYFSLDPYAVANGVRLQNVSTTPHGLTAWLQRNPALAVTAPRTTLLGHPALTVSIVDVKPSAKAPGPGATYLGFAERHLAFPVHTGRGESVRLYLTSIRLDTVVHTLAVAVAAPSQRTLRAVLPTAEAIIFDLKVAAAPVEPLSALSSFCTQPFGGTCAGELTAGTHTIKTFRPALTYAVPVGWTNAFDHPGVVGLIPPGGDFRAIDSLKSDYIEVFTSIATAREGCADGPSTIHTPAAFVRWLQHEPGLTITPPAPVTIGGLSGVVVDIRMRRSWKTTCPWSQGAPAAQVLTGLPPSPNELAHGMSPQPMVTRLYLLAYRKGTLGIEITEVKGSTKLDAYSAVVRTFRFATL